jgi:hypothetical protein
MEHENTLKMTIVSAGDFRFNVDIDIGTVVLLGVSAKPT